MRFSLGLSHNVVLLGLIAGLLGTVSSLVVPARISEPAASPADKAMEDLSRIEYPSLKNIRWRAHFIRPNESLESLFGADWVAVARFNRLDRRHAYPGMTIKIPDNLADIRDYTPLPRFYEPARRSPRYILVDVTEQWLAAYERGRMVFSAPAATGKSGHETPTGMFRIDARHRCHTSSLYKTASEEEQYPMDNALRFYIGSDNVSYWLHARDLPGRPASHGCIGLFDEKMQKRVFGTPLRPVLADSQKLYAWAASEAKHGTDYGTLDEMSNGPVLEIRGELPRYLPRTMKRNF
jgi:hypothetical protein